MKKVIEKEESETILAGQIDFGRGIVAYVTKEGRSIAHLLKHRSYYGFGYLGAIESGMSFVSETPEHSVRKAIRAGRAVMFFESSKEFHAWAQHNSI